MKRLSANIILFVFVILFIILGIRGKCFARLTWETLDMLADFKNINAATVMDAKETIDKVSSEELSYHDMMMDIDSIRTNLLGTRVTFKDDTTIVKSDSGYLMEPARRMDDLEIDEAITHIQELKAIAENNGANFLYCAAPTKNMYEIGPHNIVNYSRENYSKFISMMIENQIPVLDFSDVLRDKNVLESDMYYYTDHHWKVRCGFIAATAICEKLSVLYGFHYDTDYANIKNYSIQSYPDWFLGSYGKKVGTFYTWHGADDFELITPNFETSLVEEEPLKRKKREGSFEETVLFLDNMEKDYYHKNTYAAYSGGDFRLQIIRNNLNPEGKKVLLIRDSFACVVTPFLSLQTKELHICDMRDYITEGKMNLAEYIREQKPDYVIVLFAGVNTTKAGGRLDFF